MGFAQALEGLLGGNPRRQEYEDFVNRYNQGPPSEGYSDQEVAERYQQIAPKLPPQDYQQAAVAAFERMSPQEREQFAQYVQQQARQQNVPIGDILGGRSKQYQDPGSLAQATTQLQQQQPDLLGGLLGSGGALSSPLAKAALAGIAAMAAQRFLGGRQG
jgi:hypothetical protein